jgi:hypothetical protein
MKWQTQVMEPDNVHMSEENGDVTIKTGIPISED